MTEDEKRDIIEWIRAEHAQRRALNIHAVKRRHPELLARVYAARPYWGWRQAVEDAGIDYKEIRVNLLKTVRCEICGFEGAELASHLSHVHGLTGEEYRKQHPGAEMSSEARRAVRMKKRNRLLPHWEPLYSDEYMMDRAWRHHLAGHPLNSTWVFKNDVNLWRHVYRQGKDWKDFVTQLGIPYPEPHAPVVHTMGADETLATLRSLAAERGQAPTRAALEKIDSNLVYAVRKHFGRYSTALRQAGLTKEKRKARKSTALSREEALEQLRDLAKKGEIITPEVMRLSDPRLHRAISKQLGGYPAARREIGAPGPPPRRTLLLSPDAVLEALRARSAAGIGLRHQDLRRGPHRDFILLKSAAQSYGELSKALAAAGVIHENGNQRRAREHRERVAEAIRQRHAEGLPLRRGKVADDEAGAALLKAAISGFTSWSKALAAAGVEPEPDPPKPPKVKKPKRKKAVKKRPRKKVKKKAKKKPKKKARKKKAPAKKKTARAAKTKRTAAKEKPGPKPRILPPNPDEIVATLKKRHAAGITLIKKEIWAGTEADRDLVRTAREAFGSWRLALRAAGIDGQGVLPPRENIIAEMRRLWRIDSELLSVAGLLDGDLPRRRLLRAIMKEFGSLQTALCEAGLVGESPLPSMPVRSRRKGRPPGSKNRSKAGEPPHPSGFPFPGIPAAFDPAQQAVIDRILARQASGAPLRFQAMMFGPVAARDPDLYRAATKLFGNWKEALRAAGVMKR